MTSILPLTMRREYSDIVFFWKCLYGNYDVIVNDFVFSDSIDSGFLMVPHPCVVQTGPNVDFSTEQDTILITVW